MAKLTHVSRKQVIASHKKLEKLLAKDPQWKKEKREMAQAATKEKKRRDAEHRARKRSGQNKMKGGK